MRSSPWKRPPARRRPVPFVSTRRPAPRFVPFLIIFQEAREPDGFPRRVSFQNIPEVDVATQQMSSLNSLETSVASPTTMEKKIPTVYICGLIPKRYHNQALYAIAHDLMPDFFISTNPIQPNRWSGENCREMIRQTEALIFLLNEVTVVNRHCLMTLQYAWELNVPVVMLRQPRVRLIIKPASAASKATIQPYDPSKPNMPLLQDIIYEAYKYSIEYDRNNHLAGTRKLTTRLRQIVDHSYKHCGDFQMNMTISPLITKSNICTADNNYLKLPPIPSPPHPLAAGYAYRTNTLSSSNLTLRSSSLINLAKAEFDAEIRRKNANGAFFYSKTNGYHQDGEEDKSNFLAVTDLTQRLLNPFESTDDPTLYHETQYLLFPLKHKADKPRLIRFPSVLTDKQDEQDTDSIWGSDTSLEEEAERAKQLTGDLDISTPPRTPAPYIDPL